MKNITNKKIVIKEIMAFLFLSCFTVKANAQLELVPFFDTTSKIPNDFVIVSDKENPLKDGLCHKLCSHIDIGKNGTWSRYYFKDVPQTEQWYKGFVFLKFLAPNSGYYNQILSVFDVANNKYWQYIDHIDNNTYMHLSTDVPDPQKDFYYFASTSKLANLGYNSIYYKEKYFLSPLTKDTLSLLTFLPENDDKRGIVYYYKVKNADFINDKIPDNGVNKNANYLFLQRDYKLGNKYNTVIFPVDVPLHDYHHVYNNGSNRLIVYRLNSIDDNSLNFVRDTEGVLKANTPYIIKGKINDNSTEDDMVSEYYMTETPVDKFDINCISNVMNSNGISIFAQYYQYVVQDADKIRPDEDIFIVSNNKLINCRNIKETTVKRFRWYIKRPRSSNSIPMTITLDDTTGINPITAENNITDKNVYSLSGEKVGTADDLNSLRKGYYIVNGKVRLVAE